MKVSMVGPDEIQLAQVKKFLWDEGFKADTRKVKQHWTGDVIGTIMAIQVKDGCSDCFKTHDDCDCI